MFIKLMDMEKNSIKITDSCLDFKFKIDAIKRFVLPKIDYEMMAGVAPVAALRKLDATIRGHINKSLNTSGLPK